MIDIHSYDTYIVAFSGGKDCTAAFLHLLDLGVPTEKIELWHHCIDGKHPSKWECDAAGEPWEPKVFMDWECTQDYCASFAHYFAVPLYFSWREGGFEKEMTRQNELTAGISFEVPSQPRLIANDMMYFGTRRGKKSTRMIFPQVSPDLSVRWCSAYLKRDIFEFALNNQKRFRNSRTLVITGERAEESSNRARYKYFEPSRVDRRDNKRLRKHVDHWRPVHQWKEEDVWSIIQRYSIYAHPCYYIGYSRCSCKFCIFGNQNQFATSYRLGPSEGLKMIDYERSFGKTLKRSETLMKLISRGEVYDAVYQFPEWAEQAVSFIYTMPIYTDNWILPVGAYGDSIGPT